MSQVKAGDTIQVHYHGRLTDGTTFDSSEGRSPLQFKVSSGQVIPGFDEAVMGMQIGDKKTVTIPAQQAYGEVRDNLLMDFPKSDFPQDMNPEVGMQLQLSDDSGQVFPVTIKEIKEEVVVLDGNHALAGKDLIFDLQLVAIN